MARFELALPTPDFTHADFSPFLHQLLRADPTLSAAGMVCFGPPLLSLDMISVESFVPVQCLACLGLVTPMLDFAESGPAISIRSLAHLGFMLSAMGLSRVGFLTLLLDFAQFDPSMLLHSFVCLGLLSPVPDFTHLSLPLSPQSFMCCGFAVFIFGVSEPDPAVFVLDYVHLEPSPSPRSPAWLGSSALLLAMADVGLLILPHNFGRADFSVPLVGVAWFEPPPSLLDFAHLGFSASLRSFACGESALLSLGMAKSGSFLLLLDGFQIESFLFPQSSSCPELCVFALDMCQVGFLLFLRSYGRLEFSILVLDFLVLGSPMPLRSYGCSDFAIFIFGLGRMGFSISILDFTLAGFSMLARSLA
eukprot:s656_g14.t1